MGEAATGNEQQIEYWNGRAGETWARSVERIDRLMQPVTQALLERAAVRSGERVLDVGCGCGTTSLALAEAGGVVFGVDVSGPMVARARERAAGQGNPTFEVADAAAAKLERAYGLLFSRFGVMFFADPVAAFRHLGEALVDGGRLCFACWQPPKQNDWMSLAGQAVAPLLPPPETPPDPLAPGPFAFADPGRLRFVLEQAGFVDVSLEDFRTKIHLGRDLDEAMDFQRDVGPVARALAELEGDALERAIRLAREALAPHLTEKGLDLGAACWIATARVGRG